MTHRDSSAAKVRLIASSKSDCGDSYQRDAVFQYLNSPTLRSSRPSQSAAAALVVNPSQKRNPFSSPPLKPHNLTGTHSSMLSNEKQLSFLAKAMNLINSKRSRQVLSNIPSCSPQTMRNSHRCSLLTTTSQLFCPMLTLLHICVLSPLKVQLSDARITAAAFFQSNFQFGRLIRFVCEVYLLGKPSLFDPVRQLCSYLTSITADEAQQAIEFTNGRLSLNLMGQHLADVMREQSPGGVAVHHLSVSVPFNLNERMESSVKTGEFGLESSTLFDSLLPMESVESALAAELHRKRKLNVFGDRLDEALLSRIVRELLVDVHLLWPVSKMLSADLLHALNSSMQTLLLLSSLRWLAEAWYTLIHPILCYCDLSHGRNFFGRWKAAISSGILSFVQGQKQSIAHIDGFLVFSGCGYSSTLLYVITERTLLLLFQRRQGSSSSYWSCQSSLSCRDFSTAPLQHRNHELSHDPHTRENYGRLFSSAALTKSAELSSVDGIERALTKSSLHVC